MGAMKSSKPPSADGNGAVDPDSTPELWALMTEFFFSTLRPRIVAVARELDLNPPHAALLLKLEEPHSMGQLAELMRCDNSQITTLVNRLEQKGFVERKVAPHDRRVKMIELTTKGRAARKSVMEAKRQPQNALERLTAKERTQLATAMRKLVNGETGSG